LNATPFKSKKRKIRGARRGESRTKKIKAKNYAGGLRDKNTWADLGRKWGKWGRCTAKRKKENVNDELSSTVQGKRSPFKEVGL